MISSNQSSIVFDILESLVCRIWFCKCFRKCRIAHLLHLRKCFITSFCHSRPLRTRKFSWIFAKSAWRINFPTLRHCDWYFFLNLTSADKLLIDDRWWNNSKCVNHILNHGFLKILVPSIPTDKSDCVAIFRFASVLLFLDIALFLIILHEKKIVLKKFRF